MTTRAAAKAVATTTAFALAVLAVRGFFLRWFADDYWIAAATAGHGFWGGQAFWYRVWSGRYVFNFVVALLETVGPITARPLVALAAISLVAALARSVRWTVALAMSWAILLMTRDVSQSVLWQTGLFSYTFPLAAFAWWLGSAARRTDWRWYDAVVPLLAGGCSETEVMAQIIVCSLVVAVWRRRPFAIGLASSIASMIILALAPGNAVRKAMFPPVPPLPRLVQETLANCGGFLSDLFLRAGIALVLVFLAAVLFAPRVERRVAIVAVLAAAACILLAFGASEATLSAPLPGRAQIVPHALVVAAIAALGALVPLDDRWRRPLAIGLLVVSLYPIYTAIETMRDIPAARRFAKGWDRMDAALRANRGGFVYVDNGPGNVATLAFLTHDPKNGLNQAMEIAYGVKQLARTPIYEGDNLLIGPLPPGAVRVRFYD